MATPRWERLVVPASTLTPIHQGHPWVYRDVAVRSEAGKPVLICDDRGRVHAWGLADTGVIAVRLLGRGEPPTADVRALLRARILDCDAFRARLAPEHTDAWRVVHGEGDGLPGLVVDRYGPVAVVRLYAACWVPHLEAITDAVAALPWVQHVVRRLGVERVDGGQGLVALRGPPCPEVVVVQEAGMRLLVRPAIGQKTGMFLDQRLHRQMVRGWSRDVGLAANLFAYHGGFSVAAALGGAKRVLTLDIAPEAIADAKENFRLNGIDPSAHGFLATDVFAWRSEVPIDLLIVDPPALTRDRKNVGAARSAYRKLHRQLAPMVAEGGLLCTSSCTAWLDDATWKGEVTAGLVANRGAWSWVWGSGAPPDHPVALGHAEGNYLKFAALRRRPEGLAAPGAV